MSSPLDLIIQAFDQRDSFILSEEEYVRHDKFFNVLIQQKKIIKHDKYNATGEGLAIIINNELENIRSDNRVIALQSTDVRIDPRILGQGVYFLITDNIMKDEVAVLHWGADAITYWAVKDSYK